MKNILLYILLFVSANCFAQGGLMQMLAVQDVAPIVYATWSTTNKSSNISITGSNLTFTGVTGANGIGVATVGKSSGKWYWEVTIGVANSAGNEILGIADFLPTSGNTSRLGLVSHSVAYRQNAGGTSYCYLVFKGAAFTTQGTGCATDLVAGDILSFWLDMDNLQFKMYLNGSVIDTYVTGLPAGTWYPACASDGVSGSGTANFGASAFTYYVSSGAQAAGFTAGIY